jgi:hypothetical protein
MAQTRRAAPVHAHDHGLWLPKWLAPVVVTIVAYAAIATFSAAWWASGMGAAMANTQDAVKVLQADVRSLQAKSDRLAVLESRLETIGRTLEKIEVALSRQPTKTAR